MHAKPPVIDPRSPSGLAPTLSFCQVAGDSLLCFLGALCVYVWLGQRTLYGDAMTFLSMLEQGQLEYERHVLYLPALRALACVLAPFAPTVYTTALLASQIGGAVAAALLYAAARLFGLRRALAWAVAAGCSFCTAALFFATIVELHGPFMAPAALAWLSSALLVRRPAVGTALAVGASTALATAMHSSGALLPVPVLGAFLLNAWPVRTSATWRRRSALCVLAGVVHGALVLTLCGGLHQFSFVRKMAPVSLNLESHVGAVVAIEWLLPFAPFSLLCVVGLATRAWRSLAAVVLVATATYLAPSYLVLATWREHGAYLLPIAFPAVAVTVLVLSRPLIVTSLVLSAGLALYRVTEHDVPERPNGYANGVRSLVSGRRVHLLGGDFDDVEAYYVALPDVQLVWVTLPPFIDPVLAPAALDALTTRIRAVLTRGEAVLLSGGAVARLAAADTAQFFPVAARLLPHLEAHFVLRPVQAHGFAGWEICAR